MNEFGTNNVRGGDLTSTEEYTNRLGRIFTKEDWLAVTVVIFLLLVILVLILDKYYL